MLMIIWKMTPKNKIEVHITAGEYVEEENPDPNNELHNFNYEVKNMSLLEIKRHLESSDRMHEPVECFEHPYQDHVRKALEGKNLHNITWALLAGGHGGVHCDDGHWRDFYQNLHFRPEDWEKVEEITDDVY